MTDTSDPSLPEFPSEADWLLATPPEFAPEFVGHTMERLRDVGLVRRGADDEAADRAFARMHVPQEILAAHSVPPPSPSFVDQVMSARSLDRDLAVTRLLPHYQVPIGSPEFVARTMAALRREPVALVLRHRRYAAVVCIAIATAAAVVVALMLPSDSGSFERLLANQDSQSVAGNSPSVLSHLLASAGTLADGLPIRAPEASFLWLAEEGR
jgi:hypothetical protein